MNNLDLLRKIEEILDGIDKPETEYYNGWWESKWRAEFGAEKLEQIRQLFNAPASPNPDQTAEKAT